VKTPLTILTGWLGAGKTTALNRLVAAAGGRRIAVLVNELGRISIDTQLITSSGGDVLELAGGCVCCKIDIKNDLWDGIADIVERARPDHVVLETTGIAEPAAILDSLAVMPKVPNIDDEAIVAKRVREQAAARERIQPAGVICVVDAESGAAALDEREEAAAQAVSAERVLISKLDVASAEAVRAAHGRLDVHAPHAERAAFPAAAGPALAAWLLEPRTLRAWTSKPHEHAGESHHHGGQLVAVTFADDAPLVAERVLAVVESLGSRLVRAKGFVHVAGDDRKGFVERAGIRTSLEAREPWGDAPRRSEIVLIGDDLDEAALRRALWACRAAR
jgi:G3E family GTPase